MFFTKPCLGGLQVHFNKITRRTKARRRAQLNRVREVEDFLRPYKLKRWGSTRWQINQLEKLKEKATPASTTASTNE